MALVEHNGKKARPLPNQPDKFVREEVLCSTRASEGFKPQAGVRIK
jgi:hypothetical protein